MRLFSSLFAAIKLRVFDYARELRIRHHHDEGRYCLTHGDVDGAHVHFNRMHNEISQRSPRAAARARAVATRRSIRP